MNIILELCWSFQLIQLDNKIGTSGGTKVGELIDQFESKVGLHQLMHLCSIKNYKRYETTTKENLQQEDK